MPENRADTDIIVSIPAELEPFRPALSAGLFYLAIGANPAAEIPKADCKSARVKVSRNAYPYLEKATARFGSQRAAIINALAWAADKDAVALAMLGKTNI